MDNLYLLLYTFSISVFVNKHVLGRQVIDRQILQIDQIARQIDRMLDERWMDGEKDEREIAEQ